jgi:hypothetical protein
MKEMPSIPKMHKSNSGDFRKASEIFMEVNKLLEKHGVTFFPSEVKNFESKSLR